MNSQENNNNILTFQTSQLSFQEPSPSIQELIQPKLPEKTTIKHIPFDVLQYYIFGHFSTFQLFNMRLICVEWGDLIKHIWCIRVKDQMLEQIASLDILYQKETTLKILEYKISHLQQYERMLKSFMNRMNLHAISTHLLSSMDSDAIMIVLMSVMLIKPQIIQGLLVQPTQLSHTNIQDAVEYFTSETVSDDFKKFSDIKAKPSLSINQIKMMRTEYYNKFANNDAISGLSGNGPMLARVFVTWIDSAIEYTILKHEVRLIRLQYCNVVKAMNSVSSKWPKKKKFIQGAYKLFLFSKQTHPLVRQVWKLLNKQGVNEFFDYEKSKEKVLQESRLLEENQQEKKVSTEQQQEEKRMEVQEQVETQQVTLSTLEKGLKFLKMTENLKDMVDFVLVKDKSSILVQDLQREVDQNVQRLINQYPSDQLNLDKSNNSDKSSQDENQQMQLH